MRVGLVARADRGGLGALTQEFYRQLQPDRVLGIELGDRGRGPSCWDLFPGALVNVGMDNELAAGIIRLFCTGLDVVYSAETLYRADFADIARQVGCRTVLHAMPELNRADLAPPDVMWAPTGWELDRLPAGTPVVPVPVARPALQFRQRTEGRRLYHLGAPAMLDRNGTRLLHEALRDVRSDLELYTAAASVLQDRGNVRVHRLPAARDYYDVHPHSADLLVLPRRYAGLSLPLQECAAMGMGVVTLDLEPQRQWVPSQGLVPAHRWRTTTMPGGIFAVHACDPRRLAAALDRLAQSPEDAKALSAASDRHAEEISWERWRPRYRQLLEAAAA